MGKAGSEPGSELSTQADACMGMGMGLEAEP